MYYPTSNCATPNKYFFPLKTCGVGRSHVALTARGVQWRFFSVFFFKSHSELSPRFGSYGGSVVALRLPSELWIRKTLKTRLHRSVAFKRGTERGCITFSSSSTATKCAWKFLAMSAQSVVSGLSETGQRESPALASR